MNKTILLGRLTKDPEVRYTQNNTIVVNFTIAVNRRFAKEGEQQADFINVIAWAKTGEFVSKYFKKGQQIALAGRLQTRTYEDDKGKHFITEVVAEEVYFADSKKEEVEQTKIEDTFVSEESDLPF